jgi:hypothetical protein
VNDITQPIKARWNATKHDKNIGALLRPHFHRALDAVNELRTKRAEIDKNTHLSEAGRLAKRREMAKEEAQRVGKAVRAHDAAVAKIAADRNALIPGVKDKTDVAAALRRQEIRATLSSMIGAQIIAALSQPDAPTEVLAAVLEFPMRLPPLAAYSDDDYKNMMDRATNTIVERDNGPAMTAIKEQSEAVELLGVAVRIVMNELRSAAGLDHEVGFQAWFAEATPKDAADLAAEAAKFAEDSTTAAALALPASARHTLVTSLLEKGTDELVGKPKAA